MDGEHSINVKTAIIWLHRRGCIGPAEMEEFSKKGIDYTESKTGNACTGVVQGAKCICRHLNLLKEEDGELSCVSAAPRLLIPKFDSACNLASPFCCSVIKPCVGIFCASLPTPGLIFQQRVLRSIIYDLSNILSLGSGESR